MTIQIIGCQQYLSVKIWIPGGEVSSGSLTVSLHSQPEWLKKEKYREKNH